MDGGNEQRVSMELCFIAGLSVTETLVLVQKAYENEAQRFIVEGELTKFGADVKYTTKEHFFFTPTKLINI
jgi:hypothetical protein